MLPKFSMAARRLTMTLCGRPGLLELAYRFSMVRITAV
jgi:hypothetical protein